MRFGLLFFTLMFACDAEMAQQADATSSTGEMECPAPEALSCPEAPDALECVGSKAPPVFPKGFPLEDAYAGQTSQACADITSQEANGRWQRAIESWCLHRVHHSSRGDMGNIIESRFDKSQVHDRDRPSAWWFYLAAIRTDRLDPESCEHHRIDKLEGHPAACYIMAKEWPVKVPKEIGPETTKRWFSHPHDMERFGARGPIDFNALVGYGAIPGCYPPEAFDRVDVSITAVVRRSIRICAKHGCATKWEIKEHWNEPLD